MAQQQTQQKSQTTSTSNGTNGERSMQSRVGRDKQRYAPTGERLVCGVVPLSPTQTHVLLIQSSSRKGWVLPKGGWETDEPTPSDAAIREAWEEAGIICTVARDLGTISEPRSEAQIAKDRRKVSEGGKEAPRALYRFFEVKVREERETWPEGWKRERCWMTYARAREELRGRPELSEALERSGIVKR